MYSELNNNKMFNIFLINVPEVLQFTSPLNDTWYTEQILVILEPVSVEFLPLFRRKVAWGHLLERGGILYLFLMFSHSVH